MRDAMAGWKIMRAKGAKGRMEFSGGCPSKETPSPRDSACLKPKSSVLTQQRCLGGMRGVGREVHAWVLQLRDTSGVSPPLGRISYTCLGYNPKGCWKLTQT